MNRSDFAAVLIILLLCAFAVVGLDQSWDAIAYHLPYAALRTGIVTPQDFLLSPGFQSRYDGFPAFIDLVQGGLWRLFGTLKAAALIAPLSIAPLAVYARLALRLPAIWTVAIFLAVPILHTALQAAYVDLWTNAFFSLHLAAAWISLQPGTTRPKRHVAISLLALAVAVNSKEQFYIIGALSGVLYAGLIAIDIRRLGWRGLALVLILAPLVGGRALAQPGPARQSALPHGSAGAGARRIGAPGLSRRPGKAAAATAALSSLAVRVVRAQPPSHGIQYRPG